MIFKWQTISKPICVSSPQSDSIRDYKHCVGMKPKGKIKEESKKGKENEKGQEVIK